MNGFAMNGFFMSFTCPFTIFFKTFAWKENIIML